MWEFENYFKREKRLYISMTGSYVSKIFLPKLSNFRLNKTKVIVLTGVLEAQV